MRRGARVRSAPKPPSHISVPALAVSSAARAARIVSNLAEYLVFDRGLITGPLDEVEQRLQVRAWSLACSRVAQSGHCRLSASPQAINAFARLHPRRKALRRHPACKRTSKVWLRAVCCSTARCHDQALYVTLHCRACMQFLAAFRASLALLHAASTAGAVRWALVLGRSLRRPQEVITWHFHPEAAAEQAVSICREPDVPVAPGARLLCWSAAGWCAQCMCSTPISRQLISNMLTAASVKPRGQLTRQAPQTKVLRSLLSAKHSIPHWSAPSGEPASKTCK